MEIRATVAAARAPRGRKLHGWRSLVSPMTRSRVSGVSRDSARTLSTAAVGGIPPRSSSRLAREAIRSGVSGYRTPAASCASISLRSAAAAR